MKKGCVFSEVITGRGFRQQWVCTKDPIDVDMGQTITVWSGKNGNREQVFYCTKGQEKTFGFEVVNEV